MGEVAMREACSDSLMTVAVAPHQVYGPRDNLFMPNILEAAGSGLLRVFGVGKNKVCFTHVDNYAHGLIIAERALKPGSNVLGKFYIVTDGDTHPFSEGYATQLPPTLPSPEPPLRARTHAPRAHSDGTQGKGWPLSIARAAACSNLLPNHTVACWAPTRQGAHACE